MIVSAIARLATRLIPYLPYRIIPNRVGDGPYLARWTVFCIPKVFGVYIHEFCDSDDDSAFHDHPWPFFHLILDGDYIEHSESGSETRSPGYWGFHRPRYLHRVELVDDAKVMTLFVRGPRVRIWGFDCPSGWIPWDEHIEKRNDPDYEC